MHSAVTQTFAKKGDVRVPSQGPGARNLHQAPVDLVIVHLEGAADQGKPGDKIRLIQAGVPDFGPAPRWIRTTTGATTIITGGNIAMDRFVWADPDGARLGKGAGRIAAAPGGG